MTAPFKLMMGAAGVVVDSAASGDLYIWGQGANGKTGQDNVIDVSAPLQIGSVDTWTHGDGYNAQTAIRKDGTLWTWGPGTYGTLGHGDVVARSVPTQVGDLTDWSVSRLGYYHAIFVKSNGTLWATGKNNFGQLGDLTVVLRSSPVQLGSLTTWSADRNHIAINGNTSYAIKKDGTLWAWGRNLHGAIGNATNGVHYSSPIQIGSATNWTAISAGSQHAVGIANGILYAWNRNNYGCMGFDGNTTDHDAVAVDEKVSSPVQVGAMTNWNSVSGGENTTFGTTADGKLWAFGGGSPGGRDGALGLEDVIYRSSPTQVGSLTDWVSVNAGHAQCASIKANGTLWQWGSASDGQGGHGDVINRSSPTQIGSATDWILAHTERYITKGIREV
jgi:alpha-tubulin suppressor-like RCC1 family protein